MEFIIPVINTFVVAVKCLSLSCSKYRATKRNYIRVATAEEPALFGSSQQDTPENLASSKTFSKILSVPVC